jgi:hypothetical protein
MYNFIIFIVSILCIIIGAIVKLSTYNKYAIVLFILGLSGFIYLLIRFVRNILHKNNI